MTEFLVSGQIPGTTITISFYWIVLFFLIAVSSYFVLRVFASLKRSSKKLQNYFDSISI